MALRTSFTFRERMILGWGKARRFYLAHFRPAYVRASLARRVGQCDRTGACCRLMFTCPLLNQKAQPVLCTIHEVKPKVCRLFPIDERDLRDRDIVSPNVPCGYSFIPEQALQVDGPRVDLSSAAPHIVTRRGASPPAGDRRAGSAAGGPFASP